MMELHLQEAPPEKKKKKKPLSSLEVYYIATGEWLSEFCKL